ncbi:hypothetical protein MAR_ORF096 [Marseillevirus marseillevirus]|uniref:Uncharacterized protein n=1 Tax=Marseillevirus marseillevirus TaxID=694581 RepID=D2XAA4_GBMV|nr:hypothetical protein MAR_ORF096 [Marseillevirus marseillevirus]ADB03881.1 hypothetical protein MAR_ORF096 [Marseillevirus marseillevirus]
MRIFHPIFLRDKNMLKSVLSFVSEQYLVPEEDIVFTEEKKSGDGYLQKKFVVQWGNLTACEWTETVSDYSDWIVYGIGRFTFTDQGKPFGELKRMCSANLSGPFIERYKSLLQTVDEQQKRIKELEEENARLLYAPGAEGALEAQRHFESLKN